jgi:hypothetical protein
VCNGNHDEDYFYYHHDDEDEDDREDVAMVPDDPCLTVPVIQLRKEDVGSLVVRITHLSLCATEVFLDGATDPEAPV